MCSELQEDGVSTELLLRAAGHPSPFTYIIVDRQGGSTADSSGSLRTYSADCVSTLLAVLAYFISCMSSPMLLQTDMPRNRQCVPAMCDK
jgi:hypothetical protein